MFICMCLGIHLTLLFLSAVLLAIRQNYQWSLQWMELLNLFKLKF